MRLLPLFRPLFSCLLLLASAALPCAGAAPSDGADGRKSLGNDDDTFIFMGRCPNGEMYRLLAYDKQVDGFKRSFYDYEGPAGKGTIKSQTAPRVIASRVCLALAEMAGDE